MKKLLLSIIIISLLSCNHKRDVQTGEYTKATIVGKENWPGLDGDTAYFMTVKYIRPVDTIDVDIDSKAYHELVVGDTLDVLTIQHYKP